MSPEQFEKFSAMQNQILKEGIELHVNGKIRNLTKTVDDYIAQDIQWKLIDKAWKETAQPTVDLGKDALGFGRVVKWILLPALGLLAYLRWN